MKVAQSCPTLCDPMDYTVHRDAPGQNTGEGSLSLLQGIFPTQGSNPCFLHCRWNPGAPSSIPGSGRSAGEGIGCPLQYSWASLVAKLVENPPAMWEIWIRSIPALGRSPGERKGYPLQYFGLENSTDYIKFHSHFQKR